MERIFKARAFARWADGEGLSDTALLQAVFEITSGLIDANLGGDVLKKRVALPGRGKRGGARTLLAYRQDDRVVFIYGFAKNERDNVMCKELAALQRMAGYLLELNPGQLQIALQEGALIEVHRHG